MKLELNVMRGKSQLMLNHPLLGRVDARTFVKAALKRRGLVAGTVEYQEGLEHSISHLWLSGKSESLRMVLQWIDALGYDIYVVKRKDGDG